MRIVPTQKLQEECEKLMIDKSERTKLESGLVLGQAITTLCNHACIHCLAARPPRRNGNNTEKNVPLYKPTAQAAEILENNNPRPELDFLTIAKTLHDMRRVGVTTLSITGGEPLLRLDVGHVISFAKHHLGMKVHIDTAGTFFLQNVDLLKDADVVGFSLDGSTPEMNFTGRSPSQVADILEIRNHFQKHPPPFRVKIGTVVHEGNKNDIENITDLFYRDDNSGQWAPSDVRFYSVVKQGRAHKTIPTNLITPLDDDEFSDIAIRAQQRVQETHPEVSVTWRTSGENNGGYVFLSESGLIQVPGIGEQNGAGQEYDYHVLADAKITTTEKLTEIFNQYGQKAQRVARWLET